MKKQPSPNQQQSRPPETQEGISRRTLLTAGGAATVAAGTLLAGSHAAANSGANSDEENFVAIRKLGVKRESYWKENGKYFVQDNVDVSKVDQGIIRARVDGKWHTYIIRPLDEAFVTFNFEMRKRMLNYMAGSGSLGIYNDAHNAAIGTYGGNRGDSRFSLNVAFKGMGWLPKKDKLDGRIKTLQDNYTQNMMKKMQILYAGYADSSLWDLNLQVSLELYTTINNETHTFLNQMVNPVSTACFIGSRTDTSVMPPKSTTESYELRTIARLIHHLDPNLSAYEKKAVQYVNYAHDFFHGGPDPSKLTVHNIGVIYYIVEEFDDSPYGMTSTSGGQKRVPAP